MSFSVLTGLAACGFYLASLSLHLSGLRDSSASRHQLKSSLWLGAPALILHLASAGSVIIDAGIADMGLFNAAALISWALTTVVWVASLRWPLRNLLLFSHPLAIVVLLTWLFVPAPKHAGVELHWGIGLHILFSILSYSILSIAAVQSGAVALLIRQLKQHRLRGVVDHLPPLQTMERLLFGLIWCGEILLGLAILTGGLFLEDMFAQHLAHKTVLSILAWAVFAILLWGRHVRGWRGHTAIRWTLSGFALLLLAYFGSKFVLEFLIPGAMS